MENEMRELYVEGVAIHVGPEPCGLAQLAALKYGTVLIVRACRGLWDTVSDREYSADPSEQRNGYVFHHCDHQALESAIARAIGLWYGDPEEFRYLMLTGMRSDWSWTRPGQDYLNICESIMHT